MDTWTLPPPRSILSDLYFSSFLYNALVDVNALITVSPSQFRDFVLKF